jgi:hypothetical protein
MPNIIVDPVIDAKIDDKIEEARLPQNENLINRPSTTTAEQDLASLDARIEQALLTKGQRAVNMRWENTQAYLAIFVVSIASVVSATVVILGVVIVMVTGTGNTIIASLALAAFSFLASQASLVAGFYFGRTNHARIGDTGNKSAIDTRDN